MAPDVSRVSQMTFFPGNSLNKSDHQTVASCIGSAGVHEKGDNHARGDEQTDDRRRGSAQVQHPGRTVSEAVARVASVPADRRTGILSEKRREQVPQASAWQLGR